MGYMYAGLYVDDSEPLAVLREQKGGTVVLSGTTCDLHAFARSRLNAWERAAWSFGCEAAANVRIGMSAADRSDVARYAGCDKWGGMPKADRKRAATLFHQGLDYEERWMRSV